MHHRAMRPDEVEEILERLPVGRLGLCKNGRPYVVPLHYIYLQRKIYFHGNKSGLKMDYIRANPLVCFEVDELVALVKATSACGFDSEYRSAIVYGKARLVEDTEEKRVIVHKLTEKYAGGASFEAATSEKLEQVAIVEIAITDMSGKVKMKSL